MQIEAALLDVVSPAAIAAAAAAQAEIGKRRDQVRDALTLDLEAARYAADRAFRQYDAADPANRMVAGELEARLLRDKQDESSATIRMRVWLGVGRRRA